MKRTLLLLALLPLTAFSQIDYTVEVLRLKAKADDCDGGAITFCSAAPQDPVFHVWTLDAGANENTYCWVFDNDPAAEYNLWVDIQNVQIANETNVLTTYIQIDMGGFESDNLGGIDCSDWSGDNVMSRQLAQQFDLSFIPEGTPYVTTVDIGGVYYAEIEILWIDLTAGLGEIDPFFAFTVAPNPTEGNFHVHVAEDVQQEFNVSVMDLSGRVIKSMDNVLPYQTIDINGNEPGSYLVRVECNGHIKTQTIVLK